MHVGIESQLAFPHASNMASVTKMLYVYHVNIEGKLDLFPCAVALRAEAPSKRANNARACALLRVVLVVRPGLLKIIHSYGLRLREDLTNLVHVLAMLLAIRWPYY